MALSDGDRILSWTDRISGHRFYRPGSGGTGLPEFKTNIIGDKPVARFSGSQYFESINTLMSDFIGKTGVTFFLVVNNIADPTFGAFVARDVSSPRGFNTFVNTDNGLRYYIPNGGGITIQNTATSIETGGPVILSGIWDATTSQDVYFNGIVDNNLSPSPPASMDTLGAPNWRIGNDHFNDLLTGDIAEMLLYDRALTSQEHTDVYNALVTKYFVPPQSGLQLHLKADAGTTTTGSNLDTWLDQSSNAFSFSQTGSGVTLETAQINGLPIVRIASGAYMINTGNSPMDGAAGAFIAIVHKTSIGGQYILSFPEGGGANGIDIRQSGSTIQQDIVTDSGNMLGDAQVTSVNDGTARILSWNWENVGDVSQVYDGSTAGDTGTGAGGTINAGHDQIVIGRFSTATALSWSGDIGEILVYDRDLNGTERQEVWDYLSLKWGISL